MTSYFSNRDLPKLYLDWFEKHQFKKIDKLAEADWVLLKTRGLRTTLLNEQYPKTKVIVGFPHSFQLAAKNLFWLNLKKKYRELACEISPITYLPDEPHLKEKLSYLIGAGKRIILKTNYQKRKGLKLVESVEELAKTDIRDYVVAQEVIDDILRHKGHAFNLRIYFGIRGSTKGVSFFVYPVAKMVYSEKTELITSNTKHPNGFPLLTSEQKATDIIGTDGFEKCLELISKTASAHEHHFLKDLRQGVGYYDLFGLDVIFTTDRNPLILEFNRSPGLKWINQADKELKTRMLAGFLDGALSKAAAFKGWTRI